MIRRLVLALVLVIGLAPAVPAQEGREVTVTLTSASHTAGAFEPGQRSASRSFMVDAASSLTFVIVSPIVLAVEIILPDSTRVTAGNPQGAEFHQFSLPDPPDIPLPGLGTGEHVMIIFDAPQPGTYTVNLDAGAPVTERTPFAITMIPTSDVRVALSVPEPEIPTGNPVVITALVFEGTTPVTGAVVTASVTEDVAGSSEPPPAAMLTLLDDGADADDAAGDGIYTGVFIPSPPSRYMIVARVEGMSAAGRPFERHATAVFRVSDPTSTLTGAYSATGVDDNGNGLFEQLRIGVGVNIGVAGDFDLALVLRASNGRTIASNRVGSLTAGVQTIEVNFPAADVRSLGVDAPYTIASVRLDELTESGRVLRDRAFDAVTIEGFRLVDFERRAIELTGEATGTAFDDDGDGLFDRLRVSIGMHLLVGAFYEWSGRLVDLVGTELGFDSNQALLGEGRQAIELEFDGCAIGTNGVNGPYFVRDLLMFGGGNSLVASTTVASVNFGVRQFACSVNRPPVADPQEVVTPEDTSIPITLSGSDPDGDLLTFGIVTGPIHGTLSGAPPNVTYTPNPNFNGPDSFTFKVNDGQADSTPATVSITVSLINDLPIANAGPDQTVDPGTSVTLNGTGSADPEGDPLSFLWAEDPGNPAAGLLSNPTSATPTLTPIIAGAYTFSLTVNDGKGGVSLDSVTIMVTSEKDVVCAVAADIQALINNPSTPPKAIKALQKALTDVNDACALLANPDLLAAFNEVKRAVSSLESAAKTGAPTAAIIQRLLNIVRVTTNLEIAEAVSKVCATEKNVQKAQKSFDKGVAAAKASSAIGSFISAFKSAEKGISTQVNVTGNWAGRLSAKQGSTSTKVQVNASLTQSDTSITGTFLDSVGRSGNVAGQICGPTVEELSLNFAGGSATGTGKSDKTGSKLTVKLSGTDSGGPFTASGTLTRQ